MFETEGEEQDRPDLLISDTYQSCGYSPQALSWAIVTKRLGQHPSP